MFITICIQATTKYSSPAFIIDEGNLFSKSSVRRMVGSIPLSFIMVRFTTEDLFRYPSWDEFVFPDVEERVVDDKISVKKVGIL